jgi:hypothetical protein
MVFGTIPIVGSKPQTNLSDTLKVVKDFLKAACVVFFVPYSLCMPQYNNEDMNKKICGCLASYQWRLYI